MSLPAKQLIETEYEVKLGVFEGPLDLLLYLVQKNELDPRQIPISVITDQYLAYMDRSPDGGPGIRETNLANAGEFLVMAARLMRLKARELLPADQKDELEEMEYELDRQKLIQQMLEYQKFKEAARVLRNHESRHFGAFGRGKPETGETDGEAEPEEEAGVFDLMAAFRSVVMQKPRLPVHEVEIDDVTIEDRMQEVEIALTERGRSLFEDLFANDSRAIALVVTFMAILELAKLDRIVFRQSRAMGPIWVYRKQRAADYELELKQDESHLEPLPEFKAGLVEIVQEQIKQRAVKNALEEALRDLENGILPGDAKPGEATQPAQAAPDAAAAPLPGNAATQVEAGAGGIAETGGVAVPGAGPEDDAVPGAEVGGSGAEAGVSAKETEVPDSDSMQTGSYRAEDAASGAVTAAMPGPGTDAEPDTGPAAEDGAVSGPEANSAVTIRPDGPSEAERTAPRVRLAAGEEPDPIADAALRDLMKRMREASAGESGGDGSAIPEDED